MPVMLVSEKERQEEGSDLLVACQYEYDEASYMDVTSVYLAGISPTFFELWRHDTTHA